MKTLLIAIITLTASLAHAGSIENYPSPSSSPSTPLTGTVIQTFPGISTITDWKGTSTDLIEVVPGITRTYTRHPDGTITEGQLYDPFAKQPTMRVPDSALDVFRDNSK